MDSIKLWARKGEAVRQAIELGEIAHIETASEELTDEFLLFAIESGLSARPKVFWYNLSLSNSKTIRYVKPVSRAMSVRYVRPLTEQQRALLESTMKNDASHRARMRAHGLLLSSEGITIKAIAKIYHVDRDTVSTWIKKWEKHGDKSLHDQPRSGRPTTLNTTEKELAKQYIKEEPRSLKNVAERLAQKTAKRLSMSS
jgi:transposase